MSISKAFLHNDEKLPAMYVICGNLNLNTLAVLQIGRKYVPGWIHIQMAQNLLCSCISIRTEVFVVAIELEDVNAGWTFLSMAIELVKSAFLLFRD